MFYFIWDPGASTALNPALWAGIYRRVKKKKIELDGFSP